MTNRIIRTFTVLSFVLVIVQLWALSVSAAESTRPEYRLPGGCVKTFSQSTDPKTGATTIRTSMRCEYTQAQRARMATRGN